MGTFRRNHITDWLVFILAGSDKFFPKSQRVCFGYGCSRNTLCGQRTSAAPPSNTLMITLIGSLTAFVLSGGYLLVWPIYRLCRPKRTQRRQALFRLFLLELFLYVPLTSFVVFGFFKIPDFHHALFIIEIVYFFLALFLWAATWGAWADNCPDDV